MCVDWWEGRPVGYMPGIIQPRMERLVLCDLNTHYLYYMFALPCHSHQLVQWDVESASCLRDVSSAHPRNACILQVKVGVAPHTSPHTLTTCLTPSSHIPPILWFPSSSPTPPYFPPTPSPPPPPLPMSPSPPLLPVISSPLPLPSCVPSPPSTLTCTTLLSSVTSRVPFTV